MNQPLPPAVRAREGWVVGDGVRLYTRDLGDGRPIVVVHGGPDFDHEYLVPEMDRLAASFHVVYYDQRGRGRSLRAERAAPITMASEVGDLERVRAWFGFEAMAVLGHSWGALLAMEYAIRHRQRVSHLVLMNPAPASHADAAVLRSDLASRYSAEHAARMNELRSDPKYLAGDMEADAEYYRIHFGTLRLSPEQLTSIIGRLRSAVTEEGIVAARLIEHDLYADTWSRDDYDVTPALRELDVPTLVIHGDADFVPLELVRHITDAIRRSQLAVIPDCGHFAYFEKPDLVSGMIAAFLTS